MSFVLHFRWNGGDYEVEVPLSASVFDVKLQIQTLTSVEPTKQKLLGLKSSNGLANDDTCVNDLKLKPEQRIMMLGTPNAVIEETSRAAELAPLVEDDFDFDPTEALTMELSQRPEIQEKLHRRLESVKVKIMTPPREGKKLLVIDIDHTIFALGSTAERVEELARPFLHSFLTSCYEFFDLMIWSATSMRWVEIKMKELGVSTHEDYRLVCMLDQSAMVMVETEKYGVFNCKPLEFIWRKFPEHYNPSNTVILDDLKKNFVLNPQNGLPIRPYKRSHINRETDQELYRLTEYFRLIGQLETLTHLKHRKWEKYIQKSNDGTLQNSEQE